jgi:hypothetical protein
MYTAIITTDELNNDAPLEIFVKWEYDGTVTFEVNEYYLLSLDQEYPLFGCLTIS